LPVARVTLVERRGDTSFAHVRLQPVAQADSARHVLVLQPQALFDHQQAAAASAPAPGLRKSESGGAKGVRK
jgi:rod shape-determining protein MreC